MSQPNKTFIQIIRPYIKKAVFLFNTKIKPFIKKLAIKIKTACTTFLNREKLIRENYNDYKAGKIGTQKKREQEYKEAVFKHRLVGLNFSLLMKLYTRYLYPQSNNQGYILPGEFKLLLTTPQDYILMTKTDYQKEITKQVQDQLADKIKAVREEFIEKLLPFTSGKQKSDLDQDYFAQKDASRVHYYSQQKRLEKIEERERKTILKEEKLDLTENKLDAQREQMEVKNERLGLQADKLDLEKEHLNIDKKHLDVQKEKLGVAQDRVELEKAQVANERKLFELHMTRQEIEHKTKMLELANLSLEQQKKHNDIEQTKREMEITQALHDLETRKREQTMEFGQQMLQLKEQGLENKLARKEAEYLSLQMDNKRTQLDIENKILDLRDGEFKQKSQAHLLEIERKKVGIEIDRMNIHKNERRLEERNSELKDQLRQEKIYIEGKVQQMYNKEQNLNREILEQKNRTYNVEKDYGRLMRDLRSKPTYINWQDV